MRQNNICPSHLDMNGMLRQIQVQLRTLMAAIQTNPETTQQGQETGLCQAINKHCKQD